MSIRYVERDTYLYERFTLGDCDILANAISERTGWPVIYFEGYRGGHAVVQLPDGRYLDVGGIQTRAELDEVWDFPDETEPWELWCDYRDLDDELYRTAEELIALAMTEPVSA